MYSRIGETFRIRQSDKNGSNVSCRPTKVSLLISYVIPVCTWIILCKPNPGFWCSFQTSAWTIFFMFLKAHEPHSLCPMQLHAVTGIRSSWWGHVHVVVTHIIILDYPIITQMCQKSWIPCSEPEIKVQISQTVGLIWKLTCYAPEIGRITHSMSDSYETKSL